MRIDKAICFDRLYAVDEAGRPLGVYVVDGSQPNGYRVEEEYVHLDGWRPVAVVRPDPNTGMGNPKVFPILTDHLGTPRKILDGDTGETRWSWDAKQPFGHELPNETPTAGASAFTFDLRFPGQRYDAETGLFQNGFRDYHPGLGRYVESDPLGLEAGWNTFSYSENSPLVNLDPSGLKIIVSGDRESYNKAISYLRRSGIASFVLDAVEASPMVVSVNSKNGLAGSYNTGSRSISWSPSLAKYCYTAGEFASPANILFHEIFHAFQDFYFPQIIGSKFNEISEYNSTWFTNPAEKQAVEVSLMVAKQLGEGGVYSHHGSFPTRPFIPMGVTSPVPSKGKLTISPNHFYSIDKSENDVTRPKYEKVN